MMLSKVREWLTLARHESGPPLGIRAYHKGDRVSDWTLARIIDAAYRGHITEAGKRLQLIPEKKWQQAVKKSKEKIKNQNRRKNERKVSKTPWPEIRKSDCLPLTSFLPPNQAEKERRLSQYCVSRPHEQRASASNSRDKGPCYSELGPSDSRDTCLQCGSDISNKRKGTKFCGATCRQRHRRNV